MAKLATLKPRVAMANLSRLKPSTVALSRGSSTERGYTYKWQQARKRYLAKHPLCVHCETEGIFTASNEVDHVIPHRGNQVLFWDESNWQALCKPHHSAKTAAGA